jgi:putative ABC transport system permease protein
MIVQEAVVITLVSGYSGLVAGVGLLELMNYGVEMAGGNVPYFRNPQVDFGTAITATVILTIAGILAGLAPAVKAASIQPIEAMRK